MERIQFPSSPSGFDVRVLQALFACIRRKKLVAVSSLYSKSVWSTGQNSLRYLLFVVWLPPSPVPSSLLSPFSPLSFYLYLTSKCLLSLSASTFSFFIHWFFSSDSRTSLISLPALISKMSSSFPQPATAQLGQGWRAVLLRLWLTGDLWDIVGCVDIFPSFPLPSSESLPPAEKRATEFYSQSAKSEGKETPTWQGHGWDQPCWALVVMSPSARSWGDKETSGESEVDWRGEEKRAARRRKKEKKGTLEIWKRARKNSVQNTRELTVNLQPPGEEREKGKNVFVAKKQVIWKRVDGGVEICGTFPTPRLSPLYATVVLVKANCIFLSTWAKPLSRSSPLPPWGSSRLNKDNGGNTRAEAGPCTGGCSQFQCEAGSWGIWFCYRLDLKGFLPPQWAPAHWDQSAGKYDVLFLCLLLALRGTALCSLIWLQALPGAIFSCRLPVQQSFWICWAFAQIHPRVCSSRNHWELCLLASELRLTLNLCIEFRSWGTKWIFFIQW